MIDDNVPYAPGAPRDEVRQGEVMHHPHFVGPLPSPPVPLPPPPLPPINVLEERVRREILRMNYPGIGVNDLGGYVVFAGPNADQVAFELEYIRPEGYTFVSVAALSGMYPVAPAPEPWWKFWLWGKS